MEQLGSEGVSVEQLEPESGWNNWSLRVSVWNNWGLRVRVEQVGSEGVSVEQLGSEGQGGTTGV